MYNKYPNYAATITRIVVLLESREPDEQRPY